MKIYKQLPCTRSIYIIYIHMYQPTNDFVTFFSLSDCQLPAFAVFPSAFSFFEHDSSRQKDREREKERKTERERERIYTLVVMPLEGVNTVKWKIYTRENIYDAIGWEEKKKKYRERIFVYTSLVCCHNNNLRFKDPSKFVRKRYYHSSYIIIWNNIYIQSVAKVFAQFI